MNAVHLVPVGRLGGIRRPGPEISVFMVINETMEGNK